MHSRNLHRTRRAILASAAGLALVATVAGPAAAIPPPGEPGDPPRPPPCLENTHVNSMSVVPSSTFDAAGTVRLSWNITKGCGNLQLSVGGQPVEAVGSIDVDVPTSRYLSVHGQFGPGSAASAEFGNVFAFAGRFIVHTQQPNGSLAGQVRSSTGTPAVDAAAHTLVGSLQSGRLDALVGQRVEVHVFPNGSNVADLPPWDHRPPGDFLDPFGQPLGGYAGSGDDGPDVYSVAVNASRPPYTMTHELGHAVLSHLDLEVIGQVHQALSIRRVLLSLGRDVVGCDNAYATSIDDEYWAEGTAALFGQGTCAASATEYTPAFLGQTDPYLDRALRTVYAR